MGRTPVIETAASLFLLISLAAANLCVEVQDRPDLGRWELTELNKVFLNRTIYKGEVKGIEADDLLPLGNIVVKGFSTPNGSYFIIIHHSWSSFLFALIGPDGEGTVSMVTLDEWPKYESIDEVKFNFCDSHGVTAVNSARLRGEDTLSMVTIPANPNVDNDRDIPPMCFRLDDWRQYNRTLDYHWSDKFNNNYYQQTYGEFPIYGVQSSDGWTYLITVNADEDPYIAFSNFINFWVPIHHSREHCVYPLLYEWYTWDGEAFEPVQSPIYDCRQMQT